MISLKLSVTEPYLAAGVVAAHYMNAWRVLLHDAAGSATQEIKAKEYATWNAAGTVGTPSASITQDTDNKYSWGISNECWYRILIERIYTSTQLVTHPSALASFGLPSRFYNPAEWCSKFATDI